jgi:hypothetical protein
LLIPGANGERRISLDQGHAWKMGRNDDNEVVILMTWFRGITRCSSTTALENTI